MFKRAWRYITIFFAGAFMSISDIIPGFSGGIALTITGKIKDVWGTWEKIKSPKRKGDRAKAIMFYVIFVAGSLAGTFGFAQVIKLMLNNIPTYTFWFFVVLSFSAIFIFFKFNKMKFDRKYLKIGDHTIAKGSLRGTRLIAFLTGLIVIVALCTTTVVLRGYQTTDTLKDATGEVNSIEIYISIYIAGFLASAAMVTPGMSGALILLVFGVYGNIYKGLYAHPAEHWLVLGLYFLCTLLGTVTSIFVLDKLYKKYTKFMNYLFLGTIFGSFIGMVWIFHGILVPPSDIGYLYITISVLLAIGTASLIIWSFTQKQKKEEIEKEQRREAREEKKEAK